MDGVAGRRLRRLDLHGRGEGALEAAVIDPRQKLAQDRAAGFIRLQQSGAERGAGPAKKSEIRFAGVRWREVIDLARDCQHRQSVGIVQGHGEAQDRQLPVAHGPGVSFVAG